MFQRIASTGGLIRHSAPLGALVPAQAGAARPKARSAAARPAAAQRARADAADAADAWGDDASAADEADPMAQMAQADAADASLMRLVLCAASATLVLALMSSLI